MSQKKTQQTLVFGYGSNNLPQLRERCNNPNLTAMKASVDGYTRIFAGKSKKWDNGAVASIVKASAIQSVLGSAVFLTTSELEMLDKHEGYNSSNPMNPDSTVNRYCRQNLSIQTPSGVVEGQAYIRTLSHVRTNVKGSPNVGPFPNPFLLLASLYHISLTSFSFPSPNPLLTSLQ